MESGRGVSGLAAVTESNLMDMARNACYAFMQVRGLSHVNQDGSPFTPRIGAAINVADQFVVLVVDPQRLHHVSLEQMRAPIVAERLMVQLKRPVKVVPTEVVDVLMSAIGGESGDIAETLVAYLVVMRPSKKLELPNEVELPATLPEGKFLLGETKAGSLALTRKELKTLMVGGLQGYGKSNIGQLLAYQAVGQGYDLYLVQPMAGNTFIPELWGQVPQVKRIGQSVDDFADIIRTIHAEFDRRAMLFREAAVDKNGGIPPEDIEQYNKWKAGEPLNGILLAIDEYLSFGGELDSALADLNRMGRKYGLMSVVIAHNWQAREIERALSSTFGTRLCLRVGDEYVGQSVLMSRAYARKATAIAQPGRGYLRLDGEPVEIQTYRIGADRLRTLMDGTAGPAMGGGDLTPIEVEVVRFAVEEMGGSLNYTKLMARFVKAVPQAMTEPQLRDILARWDARGWTVRKGTARWVGDRLRGKSN